MDAIAGPADEQFLVDKENQSTKLTGKSWCGLHFDLDWNFRTDHLITSLEHANVFSTVIDVLQSILKMNVILLISHTKLEEKIPMGHENFTATVSFFGPVFFRPKLRRQPLPSGSNKNKIN